MACPTPDDDFKPADLRALWLDELARTAAEQRWGLLLRCLGLLHLVIFLTCQAISLRFGPTVRWVHPLVWMTEVVLTLVVARRVCGRGWFWLRDRPMVAVVQRVWVTYLILCFSLATLNNWSGWEHDWFKPIWCTLGTFGFATMAWIVTLRFLYPAFAMYFTALAMVAFPHAAYAIHGVVLCAVLTTIGVLIDRQLAARSVDDTSPRALKAREPHPAAEMA